MNGIPVARLFGFEIRLHPSWVVILAAITFAYLSSITHPEHSLPAGATGAGSVEMAALHQPAVPGGHGLQIRVNGQQYIWRFDYPGKQQVFSYYYMYVPVGTTVTLKITSSDVAHSWWIPKLGGKMDAIPGYVNHTWFQIPPDAIPRGSDRVIFTGQCAELCGRNHANMVAHVRAVSPAAFEQFLASKKSQIEAADAGAAGSRAKLERNPQGNP